MKIFLMSAFYTAFFFCSAIAQQLAKPSPQQYAWHEQERIMFLALDPCTWQGREYDNHSTPLSRINPSKLNTDQWCRVAKLWGAKEILFVAKHTGGFCWWQTHTTNYGIRNTPWKNGKGDVLAELSKSCKKFGLNLGIYVYPGDETWGAGIGSGGKTKDPSKQAAYNKIYREQLKEVLIRYGKITEVWFDGSCLIDVSDVLAKYAKHAVILQGPQATLRWVGNEQGIAPYPAWNSLSLADLKTGVSTAVQSNPNGHAWAPLECDVPLYNHNWFWSKANEQKRRSLDELMEIYYKSAGRGSVMLLNSTPDTTGLIPEGDILIYEELGKEIKRRFEHPLASAANQNTNLVEINLQSPATINHAVIMEDYRSGERIRAYEIEGFVNGQWQKLSDGSSVGRKKIDWFDNVTVTKVRFRVTKSVGKPLIRSFSLYKIDNTPELLQKPVTNTGWQYLNSWTADMLKKGKASITLNLTPFITKRGQYEVKFEQTEGNSKLKILHAELLYEGQKTLPEFLVQKANTFYINRTAQVTNETSSVLNVTFSSDKGWDCKGNIYFRLQPIE
ncbi:MAG: alpha-L-fucosidase [Ginsengibacter sp.]